MTSPTTSFPERGAIFWPVGSGDSTTIVVDNRHVVQIDIRDMDLADDDDSDVTPVIDELVEKLPRLDENDPDSKPYLAVFVLTHADEDHCRGFEELLERVHIGEIWSTPRIWRDYEAKATLCMDAIAFRDETERRVGAILEAHDQGVPVESGDRVMVVGYDTEHSKHAYDELPDEYKLYPSDLVQSLDGEDVGDVFEAFIHAPFAGDCAAERNDTSLAMQVVLKTEGGAEGKLLLFGDLAYETLIQIFNKSEEADNGHRVDWDVALAPHHCSKGTMFVDGEFQSDIMDKYEEHALEGAMVVFSSREFPSVDKDGADPPHIKARKQFEAIVDSGHTLCTAEHPSIEEPEPVVFGLDEQGLRLMTADELDESKSRAINAGALVAAGALGMLAGWGAKRLVRKNPPTPSHAVSISDDDDEPPTTTAGFGSE